MFVVVIVVVVVVVVVMEVVVSVCVAALSSESRGGLVALGAHQDDAAHVQRGEYEYDDERDAAEQQRDEHDGRVRVLGGGEMVEVTTSVGRLLHRARRGHPSWRVEWRWCVGGHGRMRHDEVERIVFIGDVYFVVAHGRRAAAQRR